MKPALNTQLTIAELYSGVTDGKIISDIDLQRDIIYDADKQALVIDSLMNGIPLPAFYFWKNSAGILEVLDGKQRIEAIKKFRQNDLELNGKVWKQFTTEFQSQFNNTQLSVIICEGEEPLKREIFRRINTLGIPLSAYEVLNGLYHGEYLEELSDYANLPTVCNVIGNNSRGRNQMHILKWLMVLNENRPTGDCITDYVKEKKDTTFSIDKNRIHPYFKFVKDIFTDYGLCDTYFQLALKHIKEIAIWREHRDDINRMIKAFKKSDDWKLIQDKTSEIEDRIIAIVGNVSLDPKRLYTPDDKAELLAKETKENGKYRCAGCHQLFFDTELTMDHITPWSKGGRTVLSNAQLLCRVCNSSKGNKM